jgi:plasmid maintenance system killer protein
LNVYDNYLRGNLIGSERKLELVFATARLEEQCTSQKAAKKLLGGDVQAALKLLSRVNALRQAPTLKDIIVQPQLHFHNLSNKRGKDLEGLFAIDIKSRTSPWRLILRPLDENKEPLEACRIDEIAAMVEVIGIVEVSKHYE